jgi:hypothetical protein
MILQLLQIFFTDDRTFMIHTPCAARYLYLYVIRPLERS